jgi:site-specific DNA recombinase
MTYLPPPSSLPPSSIVDSYRRDSGGSRQEQSTDQQLTQIQEYCAKHGLIMRHNFVDEAKSGGSTLARDDFNRMIDTYRVTEQRPAGLLLWNYARFARDFDNAVYYKALLRTYHITVHSLNDPIPEGDYGRIVELFIDLSNEEKRRQTSADARRGLRELVQKYGCVPGVPPMGFKREPVTIGQHRDNSPRIAHRWVPDPDLIPRIQQAFTMRAAGQTLAQIQKETRLYGALNSFRTFFINRIYIGILDFGDDLSIENYCPPIVDLATWDAVQMMLSLHSQHKHVSTSEHHPRRQVATYLLSGLVRCARCNSPLYGMSSKQRAGGYYYRYACTRAKRRRDCDLQPIPARAFEQQVLEKLRLFVQHPNNLADLLELDRKQSEGLISKNNTIARDLQKQITTVRRSISNMTSAIAESGHSKAMLTKLRALESEETELHSRLLQIKTQIPAPVRPLTHEEITAMAKNLHQRLSSTDPAIVRSALLATIHSVVIDREDKHAFGIITFKHRPREPESPEPDQDRLTASLSLTPLGAQNHKDMFLMV